MNAQNGLLKSSLLGLNTGHCSGADPIATRMACCLLLLLLLCCLLVAAARLLRPFKASDNAADLAAPPAIDFWLHPVNIAEIGQGQHQQKRQAAAGNKAYQMAQRPIAKHERTSKRAYSRNEPCGNATKTLPSTRCGTSVGCMLIGQGTAESTAWLQQTCLSANGHSVMTMHRQRERSSPETIIADDLPTDPRTGLPWNPLKRTA